MSMILKAGPKYSFIKDGKMKKYDIVIIGTGQATGTILPHLLDKNMKVAAIESEKAGGTCVNWGCQWKERIYSHFGP